MVRCLHRSCAQVADIRALTDSRRKGFLDDCEQISANPTP
jgi:hypothetical protein